LPANTFDVAMDLLDLDYKFVLFRHEGTGEDVVVYRRGDGRIGLVHPPGSALAHETEIVIVKPSRFPEPVSLERVRDELAVLGAGFIYFTDERDGRRKVLYVRHDATTALSSRRRSHPDPAAGSMRANRLASGARSADRPFLAGPEEGERSSSWP
jgi:hypothetical protein